MTCLRPLPRAAHRKGAWALGSLLRKLATPVMEAAAPARPCPPRKPGTTSSSAETAGQAHVEQSVASRLRVALPHAVPWWELAARAGAARPHANIPKTSRPSPPIHPHTHTFGESSYNQPLRESWLPVAPELQRVQPACQGRGEQQALSQPLLSTLVFCVSW